MKRSFFKNVMSLAIVAVASLAITATSASAAVVTYDFDVAGDDGASIDGWTDVFDRAPSFPSGTVWGSVPGGRATGGNARWPEHTSGSQDSHHPNHIMRSPEFTLTGSSSIDFQIGGGTGSANTYTKSSDIDPAGNSTTSGQQKFYLRRVSDDTYLLNQHRTSNENSWQSHTWNSAAIAGAIAGDAASETYTVEWVDTYGGSWGFGMIDDVVLNDVTLAPVVHEVAGDNTIGTETLTGEQSGGVYPGVDGARYIRVDQNRGDQLNIAEVQAFETGTGDNVALASAGSVASQSSTGWGGVASRAIDGNTNGVYGGNSVQHTNNGGYKWWEVELASDADLDTVHIWGRTDGCCNQRLDDFNLIIEDAARNELYNEQHTGVGSGAGSNRLIPLGDLVSADLTAQLTPFDSGGGYTYVFELGSNDQIVVDNPNPGVFTTYLDINNADIVVEALGPLVPGEVYQLLDVDQLAGTYNSLILPVGVVQVLDDTGKWTGAVTSAIPEPMTMLAVGLSITALGGYIRRRRRA